MAATTAPVSARHRSLAGMILAFVVAVSSRRAAHGRGSGAAARVASALGQNLMTFVGMAAIDVGMFHLGTVAGWVAVGVSILLADFKIQGG